MDHIFNPWCMKEKFKFYVQYQSLSIKFSFVFHLNNWRLGNIVYTFHITVKMVYVLYVVDTHQYLFL